MLLRAATLAFGAVALGGVAFALIVRRGNTISTSGRRLLCVSAFSLAATQVFYVLANSAILSATTDLRVSELSGASYFLWGCASASAAIALGILSTLRSSRAVWGELACALVILSSTVATSHAAARLDHEALLIAATAVHQVTAAIWIGGLPYLLLTLRNCNDPSEALAVCKRFYGLALSSVVLLFGAGLTLSKFYIAEPAALYGTTYGIMVLAKTILFALILLLGALNFRLIRNHGEGNLGWLAWLERISEAEIGIGITVILAAASLTSQPPAIDLTSNRVSLSEINERMSPQVPRMSTPPLSTLSPSQMHTAARCGGRSAATCHWFIA